jgi:hypothetical protein
MNGDEMFMSGALTARYGPDAAAARAAGAVAPRLHPSLDAIEREIDDRRGEERQRLGEDQAADHRDAERMADLGAHAPADHQRQRAEERRHRRHHDRAKAQKARLEDRVARRASCARARRRSRSRSS